MRRCVELRESERACSVVINIISFWFFLHVVVVVDVSSSAALLADNTMYCPGEQTRCVRTLVGRDARARARDERVPIVHALKLIIIILHYPCFAGARAHV